jgi:hypothetical protein
MARLLTTKGLHGIFWPLDRAVPGTMLIKPSVVQVFLCRRNDIDYRINSTESYIRAVEVSFYARVIITNIFY